MADDMYNYKESKQNSLHIIVYCQILANLAIRNDIRLKYNLQIMHWRKWRKIAYRITSNKLTDMMSRDTSSKDMLHYVRSIELTQGRQMMENAT